MYASELRVFGCQTEWSVPSVCLCVCRRRVGIIINKVQLRDNCSSHL